ncbi:MAG: tetratricopeptide repeat protein [Saprospiraceae bacterium]|nr:tetratricopeptide repeat protein [Saprospiraceae bacterium]
MIHKTIISGCLEFGNARNFEYVTKTYAQRAETHYRMDVLFKCEEIFVEETATLNIPRYIGQSTYKSWDNTIKLLEYIAQFAVAGDLSAWMTDNGQVIKQATIEPKSEKVAVQSYLAGRELVKEKGRENEAIAALSTAIEKYERHALAYERRGYLNYKLKNYPEALEDYTKCIAINASRPEPFIGRAAVCIMQNKDGDALVELERAIKQSIPLQPVHWNARRLKAECHLRREEYKEAATELKFFTQRAFSADNPNYEKLRKAWYNYGRALLALGESVEAHRAFSQAMEAERFDGDVADAELLLQRGLALRQSGQSGYLRDWKAAADQGLTRAAELLEEVQ